MRYIIRAIECGGKTQRVRSHPPTGSLNHEENVQVELEVTLDEALEGQVIQVAREYYSQLGGAEEPIGKRARLRKICAEEFVSNARDAIMELADGNEWFKKAGIEATRWDCTLPLVRKQDYYTMYSEHELNWLPESLVVFDPEGKIKPFPRERGRDYEELGLDIERPVVIIVTDFSEL